MNANHPWPGGWEEPTLAPGKNGVAFGTTQDVEYIWISIAMSSLWAKVGILDYTNEGQSGSHSS